MTENKNAVLFRTADGKISVDVTLEKETVWLTQKQMATLFEKDVRTINEHIINVYKEGELRSDSTIRKFRIVQVEGSRMVERDIDHYNLDVIISVGYRVKSQRGTQFRIWATNTLKQHLIQGYTLNESRLKEQKEKLADMQKSVELSTRTLSRQELVTDAGRDVMRVIASHEIRDLSQIVISPCMINKRV